MGVAGFEDVFKEIAAGRLVQARKLLQPMVKAKDPSPEAMFLLGRTRWEGKNTVAANEAGFKWFKEAAKLGHLYGKLYAAIAYFNGIGVAKNRKTGIRWLEDCAGRGCAVALLELASLYLEANGVDYDIEKAIEYLTRAANQSRNSYDGNPEEFAYCASLDEFIESNESEAIAKAQEYLAYLYSGKEEDVPRNASIAAKWATKAMENGFDELIWPLIDLHLELANTDEAKLLLLRLVQKNDARAMYELARIYEKSCSKEEQDQVYRLDTNARKGGYVPFPKPSPAIFPKPKRALFILPDLLDEEEWSERLEEARRRPVDDPHELKLKVRTLHLLAKSGSDEARCVLEELIAEIGEMKYLEVISMHDFNN